MWQTNLQIEFGWAERAVSFILFVHLTFRSNSKNFVGKLIKWSNGRFAEKSTWAKAINHLFLLLFFCFRLKTWKAGLSISRLLGILVLTAVAVPSTSRLVVSVYSIAVVDLLWLRMNDTHQIALQTVCSMPSCVHHIVWAMVAVTNFLLWRLLASSMADGRDGETPKLNRIVFN